MCGIGGYFLKPGQSAPAGFLERLEVALRHRGPDGTGRVVMDGAGFCHTRLSIIDVDGGAQPFVREEGGRRSMAVANGEIYNHEALRADIPANELSSASDCAVLLPLWIRHGGSVGSRLRGMYAAALYDEQVSGNAGKQTGRGCLFRDPFGIKPLYFLEDERGVFFASEPGGLLAAMGGGGAEPDPVRLAEVLDVQFLKGGQTAFPGIEKLAPGEALHIEAGAVEGRERDAPLGEEGGSDPRELDGLLQSTIEAHQLSDVPFGMFLSGGVDSSILLAVMSRLRLMGRVPGHTPRLLAYTARFDQAATAGEARHAKMLAANVGADYIDVPYGEEDFIRDVGKAVAATDDPVADYAILPSYHLAMRAAGDVKVILTGEGGDEFFAGYGRYRAGLRPLFPKAPGRPGPALRSGILNEDVATSLRGRIESRGGLPSLIQRLGDRGSALRMLQARDIAEWLPDNLLTKVDRCLMRHGIEGRTPFVDRHLSAYGFNLPFAAKIHRGQGKHLLKSWLAENLPAANPFSPKRGFTVPVGQWIHRHATTLGPLVARQEAIERIIKTDAVPEVFERADGRAGLLAWRLLYLALWHQIHALGTPPNAPIADILAAR